jgi:hypothetical protein
MLDNVFVTMCYSRDAESADYQVNDIIFQHPTVDYHNTFTFAGTEIVQGKGHKFDSVQ